MVIAVETVFFQCARAIVRSALWDPAHHVDAKALPTPGQILAELSQQTVGGAAYDEEWPASARGPLWHEDGAPGRYPPLLLALLLDPLFTGNKVHGRGSERLPPTRGESRGA